MYALLLLGGNVGDLHQTFSRARRGIQEQCGEIVWTGRESESEAWGYKSTAKYLNQIVIIETRLSPLALLDGLEAIESRLGRVDKGGEQWAKEDRQYNDRTIDLDILYLFEKSQQHSFENQRLVVPHPRIGEREFVKELLAEVDFPEFTIN